MMGEQIKFFLDDRRGAVTMWLGLGLLTIVAVATLAVDMSYLHVTKTRLQGAADAAALAAITELPDQAAAQAAALEYADKNMPAAHYGTVLDPGDVVFGHWDSAANSFSPGGSPANAVRVITRRSQANGNPTSLFFANILGIAEADVSTQAIAGNGRPPTCLLALNPSSSSSLRLQNSATISAPGCSIHVNSNNISALRTEDNADLAAQEICTVGDFSQGGSSTLSPVPRTNCPSLGDPLASLAAPAIGPCLEDEAEYDGVTTTLDPGVYCEGLSITGSSNITFNPGVYVITEDSFIIGGTSTVVGDGVAFYLTDGATLQFDSNTAIDLKAPTGGPMAGVIFFQDRSDSGTNQMHSDGISRLEGTLYFPSGILRSYSNAPIGSASNFTILIADEFDFGDTAQLIVNSDYASSSVPVPNGLGGAATALLE